MTYAEDVNTTFEKCGLQTGLGPVLLKSTAVSVAVGSPFFESTAVTVLPQRFYKVPR